MGKRPSVISKAFLHLIVNVFVSVGVFTFTFAGSSTPCMIKTDFTQSLTYRESLLKTTS